MIANFIIVVVVVAVLFVMFVFIQYYIINFLELTDEEIKEYNEYVSRRTCDSIHKDNPWGGWHNTF